MPDPHELPAYARSLGIAPSGAEEGGMPVMAVDFGENVEGRPQHFHGGATAGLLETAGYAALRTALAAAGRSGKLKPITITVQYLSPGKARATLAAGRVTRLGRRNANVAVEAWQDDRSRPIATAVMNILIG